MEDTTVKYAVRISLLAVVIFSIGLLKPAAAQNLSIQGELLKDWTDLKTTMDKIVNEMPEDKFGFKPTPAQQTFAERAMDVTQANVGLLGSLGGRAAKPITSSVEVQLRNPTERLL